MIKYKYAPETITTELTDSDILALNLLHSAWKPTPDKIADISKPYTQLLYIHYIEMKEKIKSLSLSLPEKVKFKMTIPSAIAFEHTWATLEQQLSFEDAEQFPLKQALLKIFETIHKYRLSNRHKNIIIPSIQ
jgi:hypothetical protein